MTMINIHEAKAHLSKYTKRVKQGETIILCERNKPIAEIRPIAALVNGQRPYGLAKGKFQVPDDFNDPDPEIDALFSGAD